MFTYVHELKMFRKQGRVAIIGHGVLACCMGHMVTLMSNVVPQLHFMGSGDLINHCMQCDNSPSCGLQRRHTHSKELASCCRSNESYASILRTMEWAWNAATYTSCASLLWRPALSATQTISRSFTLQYTLDNMWEGWAGGVHSAHLGVAVEDGAPRQARGRHNRKHAHQVEHDAEEVQEEVLRASVRQRRMIRET